MKRPDFETIASGEEFNKWYWLKDEMMAICKKSGLSSTGSKFKLRDRIMYALDHNGKQLPKSKVKKKTSSFNWSKETLTLETIITDSISFGPNFRNFMKGHIGNSFSCHGDFMDWVKSNTGKKLEDAIKQWKLLEDRKNDPAFKREIADHNMYNQYLRDFAKANPKASLHQAITCWLLKKQLPTKNGFVKYEDTDLNLGKFT
ncbi:SAP domain-containing protein [Aquimarina sp. ERC-38]|uniref:DUF6434 domain-containing protein n=1 Tax=Aquimarina sp. ERC-38 TaxID=2949996 RepID=UPI002246F417|nr:DUF6434 domain-containing protein [Aquimarina sp. ERC-38]UZO80311.1 SAP domain-containing protein [Aquimarina sp. ERC-38]